MRSLFSATVSFIVLAAMTASTALAQDVASSADSFSRISPLLRVGQVVTVRDNSGQAATGILASMTPDSLVVLHKKVRLFRRENIPRSFALDRVEHIAIVDSLWEGELIGAAAGIGATALLVAARRETDEYASLHWFFQVP